MLPAYSAEVWACAICAVLLMGVAKGGFGGGIGIIIYVIRTWGNYPDAVAFAVLLMNLAAPLIDRYTQPKAYGQQS